MLREEIVPAQKEKAGVGARLNDILRGTALALGVAVAVLSMLGVLSSRDGMLLLGLGLFCLALWAMRKG